MTRATTHPDNATHELPQHTEDVYRSLVDQIQDYAIFLLDPEGRVVTWNAGAERIKGYKAEEIIGRHFACFYPKEAVAAGWPAHELDAARREGRFEDEGWRVRKDGSLFWANVVITALRDESGGLREFAKITRDLTERKRAEEALRASEARLRAMTQSTQDAIISADAAGCIVSWNKGAQTLFGYAEEEVLGQPLTLLMPASYREAHRRGLARFTATGVAHVIGKTVELEGRTKDGQEFPLELSLSTWETPQGRYYTGILRDIQERKRTEEKFRGLLESAPDAIVIVNTQGQIVLVNSQTEKLFGYHREELIGQPVEMLVPESMRTPHVQYRDNYFAKPVFRPMGAGLELHGVRKDGSQFPVEISLSPLQTAEGLLVSSAIRDVTDRKQAQRQLEDFARRLQRSNQELQQFASVAAHDLQEPLRKIETFGDRLQSKYGEQLGEQGKDYLQRMQKSAARMRKLINDLLTFSRVTSKPQPFQPVDLKQLAQEVVSDLEGQIQHTGGRVELGHLPTLDADPVQMRQLFQNLLGNALKFHKLDQPPLVQVASHVLLDLAAFIHGDRQCCQITVQDNGIGFEEIYLDRIFEVFQRLHGRQEYEGTGMGLAICRKIVERHGGTITARSVPGQGATFIVTLPLRQPKEEVFGGETSDAHYYLDGR